MRTVIVLCVPFILVTLTATVPPEVSPSTLPLEMEAPSWKLSVTVTTDVPPEKSIHLSWNRDPRVGPYFEIGPWQAGRGGARLEYVERLPILEGQVRGWYRTVGVLPYTVEVSLLFQGPGERARRQSFSLGPSPEWSEFVLPIRRAPESGRSVIIAAGLRRLTEGRVQFAGVTVSGERFQTHFPEQLGPITRPAPPAKQPGEGFYRIGRADGAWWLITPDGRPFYSIGTDGPRFEGGSHEHYLETLRVLGFNSLAGWTDLGSWGPLNDDRVAASRFPPAVFSSLPTSSARGEHDCLSTRPGHTFPDPFDPRWEAYLRAAVRRKAALVGGKSWFVGFFAGNEIDHSDLHRRVYTAHCGTRLQRFLEQRHQNIGRLNAAWGSTFKSFSQLIEQRPDPVVRAGAMYQDFRSFKREIVRHYVDTVLRVIREEVPDHLVFSPRFMLDDVTEWMDVIDLYQPFDAIGVNMYPANLNAGLNRNELAVLDLVHRKTGRPIVISEWSVPALDSGLYGNPDRLDWSYQETVDTQEERARQAAALTAGYYNLPYVIGAHWFTWRDFDSEARQANRGLFKASGEPWEALQKSLASANRLIATHWAQPGRESRLNLPPPSGLFKSKWVLSGGN